jgi:glycyl-tRNA synthetase
MTKDRAVTMEKIVSLAKRRGFIFPGSEIYGGLANSWDYGPLGVELKNNIKAFWWERFVRQREDIVGLDSALLMNPRVWEASGHFQRFIDPLLECQNCHSRFRADDLAKGEYGEVKRANDKIRCPHCEKGQLGEARPFNLMFKTFLGPAEDEASLVYFRPETAQGMFVNFKNILDTTRLTLPFGIAQIGKAFRNEITPGNFIFRTREFEMMEIEYFVRPQEWEQWFEYWRREMLAWIKDLGINLDRIHQTEIPEEERAHYSKRTIDFEYDFPFGRKELYGLAYRTDFDLSQHEKFSGVELKYRDPESGEEFWPHVIEPTWGVDRSVLVVLLEAYEEEKDRLVLRLPPQLAPYKAAVFPLLANKPELVKLARKIYDDLKFEFMTAWDDRGNIGKRYYSQDEIGTPFSITVDFDSLADKTVTIRDRDTTRQERVAIDKLKEILHQKLKQ